MNFYHGHKYLDLSKNLFQKILIQNCKKFPIRLINSKSKEESQIEKELIQLADQLIILNEKLSQMTLESSVNEVQGKIDYCEDKINKLFYQLYELTDDDINLVEMVN